LVVVWLCMCVCIFVCVCDCLYEVKRLNGVEWGL